MSVIVLLITAGAVVAIGFLGAFIWAVRSGQYDDTCTPALRMLRDDGLDAGTRTAAHPQGRASGLAAGTGSPSSPSEFDLRGVKS